MSSILCLPNYEILKPQQLQFLVNQVLRIDGRTDNQADT